MSTYVIAELGLFHQKSPLLRLIDYFIGPFNPSRVSTAEEQAAYTLATGFQPYQDATTGFTRFADVRAQQPNLLVQQGLVDPQLLFQQDPAQGFSTVERKIEHTAAQLQQMAQPQGQPVGVATPVATIFGAAAAQQGQAMQQIEQLVGQRAAMQNNFVQMGSFPASQVAPSAPGTTTQQQQPLDPALWMQNQAP